MNNKTIIEITKFDDNDIPLKLNLEIYWDANLDDWVDIFKTILTWMTFHPNSIDAILDNSYKSNIEGKEEE